MVRLADGMTGRLVLAIALMALLLTACGTGRKTTEDNPYTKYYTGKDGVVTTFQGVPTRFYYYGAEDTAANEYSFGVEVKNQGASFTRGGVYLSGFDPEMLVFEGIDLQTQPQACGIRIGHVGFGDLAAAIQCDGFAIGAREGNGITDFELDNIGEFLERVGVQHERKWLDGASIDYSSREGGNFVMNFGTTKADIEYYQHGRLFIYILSGINFEVDGGREFLLAGDTYEFPGGEQDYFTYNMKIASWPPGADQLPQHLQLTTCYQYTTYANPVVCIDPDPTSDMRKVCTPKARTWNGGNGAPVAITSIEQENTPKKVIFRINVKNIGNGDVFDPGKLNKCNPYYNGRVTPEDLNVVYLGDVRVGPDVGLSRIGGDGGISCYPEVIRLDPRTKSGTTTCTYPMQYAQMRSAYETPLTVELWYGYRQEQGRTITIKRVI